MFVAADESIRRSPCFSPLINSVQIGIRQRRPQFFNLFDNLRLNYCQFIQQFARVAMRDGGLAHRTVASGGEIEVVSADGRSQHQSTHLRGGWRRKRSENK